MDKQATKVVIRDACQGNVALTSPAPSITSLSIELNGERRSRMMRAGSGAGRFFKTSEGCTCPQPDRPYSDSGFIDPRKPNGAWSVYGPSGFGQCGEKGAEG